MATIVRRFVGLVLAVIVVGGCGNPAPIEVEAPPVSVDNPMLGLRIASLPPDFVIVDNAGDQMILGPADPTPGGRVRFDVRPPGASQNIPGAVTAHQEFVESQEGGDYKGAQELISPLGTTFYSRGRYILNGESIEETVIFALHPTGDRMMTITYRYPAGVDSSVRVQQLFDVLAEVEGLEPPPAQ